MFGLIKRFADRTPKRLERLFKRHRDPLLRGDLEAYAAAEYPPAKYPTAWQKIPEDIRRPMLWDGRLLNGRYAAELAKVHFTDDVVRKIMKIAGRKAALAAGTIALLIIVFAYGESITAALRGSTTTPFPAWAVQADVYKPIIAWGLLAVAERAWIITSMVFPVLFWCALLFISFYYFAASNGVRSFWNNVSDFYRTPTRETLLNWKANAATRKLQYEAYCDEVEQATGRLSEQPLIPAGRSSGLLRSRSDMEAPVRGQTVAFDGESLRTHVLITGDTGAGKTRLAIHPLFRRIMNADWGTGHKIGAYITDGKGTLWRDLVGVVEHRDDIAVLGTRPDHYGVDLVKGMNPLQVASTFKAVSGQIAGRPSEDFWPLSASILLQNAAMLAQVLDMDPETVQKWQDKRFLRPYSLLGIALLASEEKVTREAFEDVHRIAERLGEESDVSEEVEGAVLSALGSIDWFDGSFLAWATETKSSVIANVNVVLGNLSGAPDITNRFCRGTFEKTVDMDHALKGGIIMVAVGETEHGIAGKVVNCWLKTRLYILANRRLDDDPEGCRNSSCALFADEFQMLATSGPNSDTSFWNIARQTGVFLVAASQSFAALQQVLGADAMANLVPLLKSKIFLESGELSTLDYAQKIAGETARGWEPMEGFYSSHAALEMLHGSRPNVNVGSLGLRSLLPNMVSIDTKPREVYRGGYMRGISLKDPQGASADGMQIANRKEDKNREALLDGLTYRSKVEIDELRIGAGKAFAIIQRAGGARMDIIDLHIDD